MYQSFCGRHQKHKVPTKGPYYNWSPELTFGATCTIFEPEPVQRLPGPAVGPQGPENWSKTQGRPDLSFYPFYGLRSVLKTSGHRHRRTL